jgi:hypothetical protein
MQIHDIVLILLRSGVALQWDGTDWLALIADAWVPLDNDPADVQADTAVPDLIAA